MISIGAIAVMNESYEQINQITDGVAGGRRHSLVAVEEGTGAFFSAVAKC